MKKLYASKCTLNPHQETNIIEIPESVFLVNGYSVGDRLLEDVMFEITFNPISEKVIKIVVQEDCMDYFNDLNTGKWLKEVQNYANRILETGDEVDIPIWLKKKYYKGRNVSFISSPENVKI